MKPVHEDHIKPSGRFPRRRLWLCKRFQFGRKLADGILHHIGLQLRRLHHAVCICQLSAYTKSSLDTYHQASLHLYFNENPMKSRGAHLIYPLSHSWGPISWYGAWRDLSWYRCGRGGYDINSFICTCHLCLKYLLNIYVNYSSRTWNFINTTLPCMLKHEHRGHCLSVFLEERIRNRCPLSRSSKDLGAVCRYNLCNEIFDSA